MLKILQKDGKWHVMSVDSDEPVMICEDREMAEAYVQKFGVKVDVGTVGVLRIDNNLSQLRPPQVLANGYLKVEGFLTRTGVFPYTNPDGSRRNEYRPPEEVFKSDSLETFAMAPVTDDHPPVFLNAKNTSTYQKGQIGDNVVQDGNMMRARILITDAELRKKIEAGKAVQISNGYHCDLDMTPGVTPDGQKYDAIQRNIRCNHVAIVPVGRAGPQARVRMDSAAAGLVSISDGESSSTPKPAVPPGVAPVNKIKIDGVEYEAGSAAAAAAQAAYQAKLDAQSKTTTDALEKFKAEMKERDEKRDAEMKKMQEQLESTKGRADAEAEKNKKLETELKEAPSKAQAAMKSRMKLEHDAKIVLGKKFKFDGVDDKAVKLAVLKETNPELKLEGKHDSYIEARFDAAIEEAIAERDEDGDDAGEGADSREVLHDDEDDGDEVGNPDSDMTEEEMNAEHTDAATAREAMVQRHRNAWKQPIGGEQAA